MILKINNFIIGDNRNCKFHKTECEISWHCHGNVNINEL